MPTPQPSHVPVPTQEELAAHIYAQLCAHHCSATTIARRAGRGADSTDEQASAALYDALAYEAHLAAERFEHASAALGDAIDDWESAVIDAARFHQFMLDARMLALRLAARLHVGDPMRPRDDDHTPLRPVPIPDGYIPTEWPRVAQALTRVLEYTAAAGMGEGDDAGFSYELTVAGEFAGDQDQVAGDHDQVEPPSLFQDDEKVQDG